MAKKVRKLSKKWIEQTRDYFREFLSETDFPDLDHCWMSGSQNNRWLFAAMGLTIQMHQLDVYKQNQSTWNIKKEVLG